MRTLSGLLVLLMGAALLFAGNANAGQRGGGGKMSGVQSQKRTMQQNQNQERFRYEGLKGNGGGEQKQLHEREREQVRKQERLHEGSGEMNRDTVRKEIRTNE